MYNHNWTNLQKNIHFITIAEVDSFKAETAEIIAAVEPFSITIVTVTVWMFKY